MASNLQEGETVYIPRSRLGLDLNGPALYRTTVLEAYDQPGSRTVSVGLPGGGTTDVPTSAVARNLGILILRVGDFETELTVLDPLSKSLLQFCRLLVPDDVVRLMEIRALAELEHFWQVNQAAYTHVLLVAHGQSHSIRFGVDNWVTADELGESLSPDEVSPKMFLSLGCNTGYAAFSQNFSLYHVCEAIIAPFEALHPAVASHFAQTFLTINLLEGRTPGVAFRRAKTRVSGMSSFRMWKVGQLK